MSGPEEARTLLGAAERDLRALKGMTDTAIFDDEIVGFHAQQAAEKLLKVWLTLLSEHYPLTHDLDHLLRLVQTREPEAEQFRDLVEYNPYAVQFRYEYVASEDTAIDREEASKRLDALRHHVVHRLAEIENQRELHSGPGRDSERSGDSPPEDSD